MATIALRLRGVTPLHLLASALSAVPVVLIGSKIASGAIAFGPRLGPLLVASVAVAALPWLSRAIARRLYRAKCDEVAVHVRGEAMPYRTITSARIARTGRRHTLVLERGETSAFHLVVWDAFAGRLQPIDELGRRLAANGHQLDL